MPGNRDSRPLMLRLLPDTCRARRTRATWTIALFCVQLAGCGFGVPIKDPVAVTEQTQRSATIRPGESTRDSVRAAFGEPWLQSRYWGVDLYLALDTSTELGGLMITIWPVPLGVFTSQVEGYVMVAYDPADRVVAAATGNVSNWHGSKDPLMLKARDLNLGIEKIYQRGPQLMADASRLPGYVALRRQAMTCTVILACEETGYEKWAYEGCPDRVVIDDAEPMDPTPFFGVCDPADSCPSKTLPRSVFVQVPLVHPVTLPAGPHRLTMTSTTFKGESATDFECAAGEVRYGIIHGQVSWHWWGPRSSTLTTSVSFEDVLPAGWGSYSMLLYRGRWYAEPEPDQP
jgi:hypothetical protein